MRVTLSALTGLVPFGRMYVGAHLPLDLVGGSALGLALGSMVNLVRGRRRASAVQEPVPLEL
jgi:undecaprenyl-diphosphatase